MTQKRTNAVRKRETCGTSCTEESVSFTSHVRISLNNIGNIHRHKFKSVHSYYNHTFVCTYVSFTNLLLLCTFVLDSDSFRTRKQEEKKRCKHDSNLSRNSYLCGHTTTNFLNWIKIITSKINKISTNNLKILGYIYIYLSIFQLPTKKEKLTKKLIC